MLKSNRLLSVLCRTQSCSFSTSKNSYARSHRKEPQTGRSRITNDQPGIGSRLKIIKEDQPEIEDMELEEGDIEDLEEDFLGATEIANKHQREREVRNFNIGLKITERKYFKQPKEPNLLSWSEKEQIRNLHSEDRLVWTVEKLSESFPATQDIIVKVLKATWKPANADKARKHDEAVAENWRKFYSGQLAIHNPELAEHLKKFNRRNALPKSTTDYSSIVQRSLPEPKSQEFSSIIDSYRRLKLESENGALENCHQQLNSVDNVQKETEKEAEVNQNGLLDNIRLNRKIHSKLHTLDTLRSDVAKSVAKSGRLREMDEQFIRKYVDEMNAKQVYENVEEGGSGTEAVTKRNEGGRIVEKLGEELENDGLMNQVLDFKHSNKHVDKELEFKNRSKNERDRLSQEDYSSYESVEDGIAQEGGRKLCENYSDRRKERGSSFDRLSSVESGRLSYGERRSKELSQDGQQKVFDRESWNTRVEDEVKIADVGRIDNNDGEVLVVDIGSTVPTAANSRSIDTGVVNENGGKAHSKVRLSSYESEFNAHCKFPPARYSREGEIIWKPEKRGSPVDEIPYRIRIPRDKIRKGYLYKVNDCFYTHEGEFLYRVPGMSS